jgi:excisionase family DNA binding protein
MSEFPSVRTRSISKAIRGAAVIITSEWLTAFEAAELLRVRHRTVLKWVKTGQIPAHRLSGSKRVPWRFLKSEPDAMLSGPICCRTWEGSMRSRIRTGSVVKDKRDKVSPVA